MNKKKDLRIVKTQMAIKNAFLQLVKEKAFEKITISEIADRALIHRGTFYSHYKDKYDLLNQLEDEIVDDMGEFVTLIDYETICQSIESKSPLPHIVPLLTYIEEHLPFFDAIMNGSDSSLFFSKMVSKYFDQFIANIRLPDDDWLEYRKDLIHAITTSVLSRWINNGMKEKKEDLASWLTTILLPDWDARKVTV